MATFTRDASRRAEIILAVEERQETDCSLTVVTIHQRLLGRGRATASEVITAVAAHRFFGENVAGVRVSTDDVPRLRC